MDMQNLEILRFPAFEIHAEWPCIMDMKVSISVAVRGAGATAFKTNVPRFEKKRGKWKEKSWIASRKKGLLPSRCTEL